MCIQFANFIQSYMCIEITDIWFACIKDICSFVVESVVTVYLVIVHAFNVSITNKLK